MKALRSLAWLMLLLSFCAWAEGGKERGDVGQGGVVQTQVRKSDSAAGWTPTVTTPTEESVAAPDVTLVGQINQWLLMLQSSK